ncbi:transposase [Bradyrhizobium uaiense]|nr:transposase [Bradyrhizobium uaiense]
MIEAVADRLEGAPRQLRRRWSDELKAQVVTEALEPGASVSAIARRIGIHPSQLFAWRRDARAERRHRSRHSSCEGVVASVAGAVIEIAIGEVIVRVGADVDEAHLQRVLRAVVRHDPLWCEGVPRQPSSRLPQLCGAHYYVECAAGSCCPPRFSRMFHSA